MKIVIDIETGNDVFVDNYDGEIDRILALVVKQASTFGVKSLKGKTIQESNGNTVAKVNVTGR